MSKWCEIRVMKFLEIYQKHECLWNSKMEGYKNKTERDAAFEEILQELQMPGLTANDIKLKIKSVRTTYKRELTSVLNAKKNGKNGPYIPKLFWFKKADSFLRPISLARKGCAKPDDIDNGDTNFDETNKVINFDENQSYKMEISIDDKSNMLNDDVEEICTNPHNQKIVSRTNIQEMVQEEPITITSYSKTNDTDFTSQPFQIDLGINNTTSNINTNLKSDNSNNPEDEFVLFCRSVAAQLRGIPDSYSRSVAKFKIQQILFEAETGEYRKSGFIPMTTIHRN